MKTYWLQAKECRTPITRLTDSTAVEKESEVTSENKEFIQDSARVVVYSPITFQDVARRSIASSPVKSLGRGKLYS